jgi:hypothetical protein
MPEMRWSAGQKESNTLRSSSASGMPDQHPNAAETGTSSQRSEVSMVPE